MYYHLHSHPIKNGMLSFFITYHLMDFLLACGCVPGEAGRAGAIGRVGAGQSDHGAADLQH